MTTRSSRSRATARIRCASALAACLVTVAACSSNSSPAARDDETTTRLAPTSTATTTPPSICRHVGAASLPVTSPLTTTRGPVSYHGVPTGPRVPRATTLPPAPPPRPNAPLLGYRSHAVVDWATGSAAGPVIETLDLDTGRFLVRAAPVDAGETAQDPVGGTTVAPTTMGLAQLAGGLVAASPYESRWYPNGATSSRVLDTAPGALYSVTVLRDDAAGNAVVVRGQNPYRVMVVRGSDGVVVAQRDVGFASPLAAIAADHGAVYFVNPNTALAARYDPATGQAARVSFADARLARASHGWLVWQTLANGLLLTRTDGTRCTTRARVDPAMEDARVTDDGMRALVTSSDRGGGAVVDVDLRTGMSTDLVNAYDTTGAWFLSSKWAIVYGLYHGQERTLLGLAPPGAIGKPPRTIVFGQVPGVAAGPLGLDAGETTS